MIAVPEELVKYVTHCHGNLENLETKYNELKSEVDALHDNIAQLVQQAKAKPKTLQSKERETLLKLIVGMALGGYGYDPLARKSATVKEIFDDLALRGIALDQDTIRNKLKEASLLVGQSAPLNHI